MSWVDDWTPVKGEWLAQEAQGQIILLCLPVDQKAPWAYLRASLQRFCGWRVFSEKCFTVAEPYHQLSVLISSYMCLLVFLMTLCLYCKEFIRSNFTASKDQHFGMSKAVYGLTSLAQEKISNCLNMLKNFLCVQVSNAILSFLLSNAL